jgi:hypothetical protein
MPIRARRHLRKLRGGAQSHLIECADDNFYVVKFQNNPQHRRILPNEWIASVLLKHLQISTPETAIIEVTGDFLREFPECCMQLGPKQIAPEPGWHFGSRYPGNPERLAIYDFVPDQLLSQVHNISEFLGALVFDKWTGNADSRQSIFFRAQISEWLPAAEAHPRKMGFVALLIDHGYIFNGPHWEFFNSPLQGLYTRKLIYNSVRSLNDFQPWLDRVQNFPDYVLDEALRTLPPQWTAGEEDQIEKLLEQLLKRRKRVGDFIADCRMAKANPFANWPA